MVCCVGNREKNLEEMSTEIKSSVGVCEVGITQSKLINTVTLVKVGRSHRHGNNARQGTKIQLGMVP